MSGAAFLEDARRQGKKLKEYGDRAMAQISEKELFVRLDPEANSVALIAKHLSGNMRSRWTDFLTADGEKPDRDRDSEFEDEKKDTPESIRAGWEEGWRLFLGVLDSLKPEDLDRTVTIRGEPHTVLQAVQRQLLHYASHVGQIVFLAKHLAGPRWKSLSIPRGQSKTFEVSKEGKPYRMPRLDRTR